MNVLPQIWEITAGKKSIEQKAKGITRVVAHLLTDKKQGSLC